MLQLIKKLLLMLLILFVVDKPIGFFISKFILERQADDRIEKIFSNEINHQNLILGSSRAASDLSPIHMHSILKESIFNLGYSGSNLNFHKSILKIVLSKHIPERVILILDGPSTFIPNEITVYRKDRLYPYLKYEEVLNELSKHSNKHYWSSILSWTYRENQNFYQVLEYFRNGVEPRDYTNSIDSFGFIPLPENEFHQDKTELSINIYDKKEENGNLRSSFNEIVKLCKLNEIELLVINPPLLYTPTNGFNQRMKSILTKEIKYLDYHNLLKDKRLYFDNGHLNILGSKLFSIKIAEDLTNGI